MKKIDNFNTKNFNQLLNTKTLNKFCVRSQIF